MVSKDKKKKKGTKKKVKQLTEQEIERIKTLSAETIEATKGDLT